MRIETGQPSAILSHTITHPDRVLHEPRNQGAALIILNQHNQVLLAQQGDNDPKFGRKCGQWNIITETRESGERVRGTVRRAIQEELGTEFNNFIVIPGTYRETNREYEEDVGYPYYYRCVALMYRGSTEDPNCDFHAHDGEITQYAWVSFKNLDKYDIEYGARLLLDNYREQLQIFHRNNHRSTL